MCQHCDTAWAEASILLADQLALAEDTGYQGATRSLTGPERRSRVRFEDLDAMEQAGVRAARAELDRLWDAAVLAITREAAPSGDWASPADLAAAAERLGRGQPREVQEQAALVAAAIRGLLERTYQQAATGALREARDQGVRPERLERYTPPRMDPEGPLALAAAMAALEPWRRLLGVFQDRHTGPGVTVDGGVSVEGLEASLRSVPMDGAVDLARQGIHQAVGAGRVDAAQAVGPSAIWASELLDGATCPACAEVDGREYPDVEAAREDYPLGGYRDCDGGARCRGTLVFEYQDGDGPDVPPPPSILDDMPQPDGPRTPQAEAAPRTTDPGELAQPGVTQSGPVGAPPRRRKGAGQLYTDWRQVDVDPALQDLDPVELAAQVNPRHAAASKVYGNNCTSCVTAYEARRRGLDVQAGRAPQGRGRYDHQWSAFFADNDGQTVMPTRVRTRTDVESIITDGPEDARYIVQVQFRGGGGHVFIAERRAGQTYYVEPQRPDKPDATDHWGNVITGNLGQRGGAIGVLRVDDKRLTDNALQAVELNVENWAGELTKSSAKPYSALGYSDAGGKRTYVVPHVRRAGNGVEVVPEAERQRVKAELERRAAIYMKALRDLNARRITMAEYRDITTRSGLKDLENEVARWRIP